MTTIVYRDGIIAADTGVAFGGSRTTGVRKIARNAVGDIAGCAGTAGFAHAFLVWFEAGEQGDQPLPQANEKDGQDKAIIIRADRPTTVHVYEPAGSFPIHNDRFAFGSGSPEANGAMFMGADARTALTASMTFDNNTHGEVMTFRLGPA